VKRHTVGFDELCERVSRWDPKRVAGICGVSEQEIESLARRYATTRPALIRANYGLQRVRGGGMAMRNIACLPALTGAFRDAAGGMFLSTSGNFSIDNAALSRPDLMNGRTPRTVNMSSIGRALSEASPPIRAMLVYNSNPVAVAPDSARVAAGFAREDLFTVVLEQFPTDTVDYADIVLPATTQLEHLDVVRPYGHYYMVANNPAIQPLGEAKPNSEIFRLLAAAMGYEDACFRDSDEALAQSALAEGWDFAAVRKLGWKRIGAAVGTARFAEGEFGTPSGKVEFYSTAAAAAGLDPLPDYIPPLEDTRSELAQRYPLAMISPPARHFLNSSFVNITSLRASEGEPWLDIHPDDAQARGVTAESYVRVFNDRGSLTLRARITDRARRGVVVALSVWWKKLARDGKNANELTRSDELTDMGRAPLFYDCLVQVEAAYAAQKLDAGT
jgi:anaerobic selenocysteine-containing dehydrogenase